MTLENLKQKITPILQNYDISRAGLFGSYASGEYNDNSDIDILIQLSKEISLIEFVRMKLDLEDRLNKKVDLVEYKAIKARLKNKILSEEVRIYG